MAVAFNLHRVVYLHLAEAVEIDFTAGGAAGARSDWVSLADLRKRFYKRPAGGSTSG